MATSTATVPTERASRYLQQLCKHWSHKFAVTFDESHGEIPLPLGTAVLDAGADALTVACTALEGGDLARLQQVVADYLDRFAFREAPLPFAWKAA